MKRFIPLVVLLTSLRIPIVTRPQEADGPQKIFHDELLGHTVGDWHPSGLVMGEARTVRRNSEFGTSGGFELTD